MSNLPPYSYNSRPGEDAEPTAAASYNLYPQQPSDPYLQQPVPERPSGYSDMLAENPYATSAPQLYTQPPYAVPQQPPGYAMPYRNEGVEPGKGMAIAGLVMGILSIFSAFIPFVGLVFPILGIVFSILGRKSTSLRVVAMIGLILSITGVIFSFIMIYVYYYIGTHTKQ